MMVKLESVNETGHTSYPRQKWMFRLAGAGKINRTDMSWNKDSSTFTYCCSDLHGALRAANDDSALPRPQFYTTHSHKRPPRSQDQQQDPVLTTRHIFKSAALHRQAQILACGPLSFSVLGAAARTCGESPQARGIQMDRSSHACPQTIGGCSGMNDKYLRACMNGRRWKGASSLASQRYKERNRMYEMSKVILDVHVDAVGRNSTYHSPRACIPLR